MPEVRRYIWGTRVCAKSHVTFGTEGIVSGGTLIRDLFDVILTVNYAATDRGSVMIKLNPEVNKGWRYRLMPHQFDWIAALLYAGSLFVVSYFAIYGILPVRYPWLTVLAVLGVVLLLIMIDRLEYWRYGDLIPRRKLALFLLLRLGLILGVGFSDGCFQAKPLWGC